MLCCAGAGAEEGRGSSLRVLCEQRRLLWAWRSGRSTGRQGWCGGNAADAAPLWTAAVGCAAPLLVGSELRTAGRCTAWAAWCGICCCSR